MSKGLILMNQPTYLPQIAVLLITDVIIAFASSYIPHELEPIRWLAAGVQLVFMAVTLAVTMRYVLEDF